MKNIYKFMRICICCLPRKIVLILGYFLGIMIYYCSFKRRSICYKNMEYLLLDNISHKHKKQIIKKMYVNLGKNLFDFVFLSENPEKFVDQYVDFEDKDKLLQVINSSKSGSLVLTAHLGSWELISFALSRLSIVGGFIVKKIKNKSLNDFVMNIRNRSNIKPIEKKNSAKMMLELLNKKDRVLGLIMDQSMNKENGVFVTLGNRKAYTLNAAAILARRYDLKTIYVFMVRTNNDRYKMVCSSVLNLTKSEDKRNDVLANTEIYNDVLVDFIRSYPDQWIWMHRRYKHVEGNYSPAY